MNSYREMRDRIRVNLSREEAIGLAAKEFPAVMDELNGHTRPCYLLDYSIGKYLILNNMMQKFTDYDIAQLLDKGLAHTERLWHADDWHTYDCYILPAILSFLKTQPKEKWAKFEVILNYRIKRTLKTRVDYFHVMQTSSYLKFSKDSLPLLTKGTIDNSQTANDSNVLALKILLDQGVVFQRPFLSLGSAVLRLTGTEKKILKRYFGDDATLTEIAKETGTSINTVNTHIKSIRNKLDAKGRDDLVKIFAVQIGVLSL